MESQWVKAERAFPSHHIPQEQQWSLLLPNSGEEDLEEGPDEENTELWDTD